MNRINEEINKVLNKWLDISKQHYCPLKIANSSLK